MQAQAFKAAWRKGGAQLIDQLRNRSLYPQQVEAVNYRINLQMASVRRTATRPCRRGRMAALTARGRIAAAAGTQMTQAKLKEPSAQLEVRVAAADPLFVEFSRDDMRAFYDDLETIQEQLDALS